MDKIIRRKLDDVYSADRQAQNQAYNDLLEATEKQIDWAYEAWDELLAALSHKDNHVRAIAAQLLCNLAKSDPEKRMRDDFEALLAVTREERFVTARHTLQAIWKVGAGGAEQREMLVDGLARRYQECVTEKNSTLIRFDIIQGLKNLYDQVGDDAIKERALALIETEDDEKYRKKYAGVWRGV